MKIFISGAVTGISNYEKLFQEANDMLTKAGYEVLNPIILCNPTWNWKRCMQVTLKALIDCQGVAILDNWENSKGSKIEVGLARDLDIPTHDVETWLLLSDEQ